jgi:amino acid adenylation domain-containing protein
VELLRSRAAERPDHLLYTWLAEGEEETGRLTAGELDLRARTIAAYLLDRRLAGERVLLLYPSGLELITAFFGCLYAGAIAVPAHPPRQSRTAGRLRALVDSAAPALVLSPETVRARAGEGLADLPWLTTDALDEAAAAGWRDPGVEPDTVAFLQYTSGSTATPKGVVVPHRALIENERMIAAAFEQSADSVVVGWLPLHHDMGLIGNVLQPLWAGSRCVLMPPTAFLQRPLRWLEAISRYRGTTSGGPDFAYDLCARRIGPADREALDLSSWTVAFSGAEPVRAETLDRFVAVFAPQGFRREAFYPCYGLAEATLFVTGGRREEPPVVRSFDAAELELHRVVETTGEKERKLVGCGRTRAGLELAIVDPETRERCASGRVGEIWLRGATVAAGYWRLEEETAATFAARLADGEGPFLRIGDLGFVDGELFVTGRLKDLIILRGRNVYPQDVERAAEASHPALRLGGSAAFPVEVDGEERLVVAAEIERGRFAEADAAMAAIALAVTEETEARPHEVVLLRPGSLPKTTSGKVQRRACRAAWQEDGLAVVARSGGGPRREEAPPVSAQSARSDLETWLRREAAALARVSPDAIPADATLAGAGLDSLATVELAARAGEALGIEVPLERLLEGATIRDLAASLRASAREAAPETVLSSEELTGGERGLWFLQTAVPGSAAWQIVASARVHPALDPEAFTRAVNALVERQPALRTAFVAEGGEPRRHVRAHGEAEVVIVDATGWSDERMRARLAEEAFRPFDLEVGRPLRIVLLPRQDGPGALALAVHHLVADLWSMAVLLRDLDALLRGTALPPAAEPARRAQGEAEEERLWAWWREAMADAPPVLEIPTDRPRSRKPSDRGGARFLEIDPALGGALRSLARERGATPFVLLLAAWQTLLGRLAGQEDVVVGVPIADTGRSSAALREAIGYFVNAVPVRGDLREDRGFAGLLERTREAVAGALAHAELPFPVLAERLRPERAAGITPLFQTLFVLQRAPGHAGGTLPGLAPFAVGSPGARLAIGGVELEPLELDERRVQLDLSLLAAEAEGGTFALSLEHRAELLDGATAERWLGHLATLLRGAAAEPELPLAALPLLSAEERAQLLRDGEGPVPDLLPGCLHELVFRQAERTPEAVAAVWGEERWTYRELRHRAGEIAARLRAAGIDGAEERVGVCLERSPWLIAALLGVLEAGCAWVPLPPELPAERLALLVHDAGARALVTRSTLAAPEAPVRIDVDAPAPSGVAAPPIAVLPESLAYLVYTSGSTGLPKGVAIEHRAAVALVSWALSAFSEEELSRVLAATSYSFDLSVFEIFAPLSRGGAVVLAADALRLPSLPAAGEVTLVNTVPSAAAELVDSPGWPASVRVVNLAGEALPGALVRRFYEKTGVARVFNLYGPSEDTTYSTEAVIHRGDVGEPPIGHPLPGKRAHVLDARLEPVPPGVHGELLIGGAGLARGYLGRPDLTAERFVPDPFVPGERLYRTGDRVRRRPDGALEFLGRIDHQVKLRGHRIEPGEIEAALLALPGVREAVVALRPGSAGPRLVAWVAGEEIPEESLRVALGRRLPSVMVPSVFVRVPSLPRTPHGKVDRKALPEPTAPVSSSSAAAAAATSLEEDVLAGLFADLLGVERVGADDGFFTLGGHSLLAMRLLFRVREALGVDLDVADVFESPTPTALAARVRAARGEAQAPPIRPRTEAVAPPVSSAQRRLWLLDRLRPGLAAYDVPGALDLRGPLDVAALASALECVVARHESLRTTFEATESGPVQRIAPSLSIPLPVIDVSPEEADRRSREEAARPFDLDRGPLVRALLLRLGPEEHRLVLVLHHAVCDGWSLELLLREIEAGYNREELPPLPVQYADFALWQRDWLDGGALARDLSFWRERLAGAPPALDLPADRPRPAVSSFRGGRQRVRFAAGPLESVARERAATPFLVLLTAFAALLGRITGEDDLVVGTAVAGRLRPELQDLIGFFVNTLPLRADLAGGPTFAGLLARVRRTALNAWAHQEVPFERLVEELRPERDLSRNPLVQVLFLLERELAAPRLSGLETAVAEIDNGTSKLDLTFAVRETAHGLEVAAEYDADLFDGVTVARWIASYGRLLEAALADPGRRLGDLPLLAAEEEAQLLRQGEGEPVRISAARLHDPVLARLARTPDEVAVTGFDGTSLTCGELDARSAALAGRLRALGVGPERIVGVCLERTPDLVVALLAVLRAGGAYLPLDPSYPPERLAWMLADAGAETVLIEERWREHVPASRGVTLSELSALPPASGPEPLPESLAYLIYTSGSTGRPKAVAIEHRSASALIEWARGAFSVEELAGVLAGTSLSFDLSVFELFVPLALGGRVVLAPSALDVPDVRGLTLLNTVPSVLAELLRGGALPSSVRSVNLAGEPLPRELARQLAGLRLRNLYGPSEDTTYSTWAEIGEGEGPPPIGRPVSGTRARVMDRAGRLAPPGVPGELWLGGAGLARGYLGRPELTAERFVPDPFATEPGSRLYRTGDLVCLGMDGDLHYLSRIDQQVKVRGFRVELGEVDAALAALPGVLQAAAAVREDGDRRLVAAVVLETPRPAGTLRQELRSRLPEFLVPSEIAVVDALPLGATGKLDRKAIAALSGAVGSAAPVAPRTALEEMLAAVMAELLGRDAVGVFDDFFALGGHSLLAHRLVLRLRGTFGVELPLRAVFESPTVAGLSVEVARALLADAGEGAAADALAETG